MISKIARAAYDQIAAHNHSSLKHLLTSARAYDHYMHALPTTDTPAMRLGSATHCAVLEPSRYATEYIHWPGERRGRAYDAFVDSHAGQCIINGAEHAAVERMSRAVREHPEASQRLPDERVCELTMQWAIGARKCKARADWIDQASHIVGGLKTAREVAPRLFAAQAWALHYDMQWAWYHDGYQTITGHAPTMIEIAVQNAAPWDVVVYIIPDSMLSIGREKYRRCLALLDECEARGEWPGLASELVMLEPCDRALANAPAAELDFGGIE